MRWSSESAGTAVERRLVLGFGVLQKPSLSPYWRRCGVPVSVTNSARQATNPTTAEMRQDPVPGAHATRLWIMT